ncbi:winged helix-turn-helix domain-containing protein [Paraferrimonas haliotis]|uniref:Transcriptional regulator n=1 Tax=Paraferrimonas haliotis TaxID=2013866 RepID=A0AA37U050_9GAMM|nr:winged helix-turn-helix domain-containing protein [Paraferrimonas haliotis]GLS84116.1 transcriptional regulator [Paraferrimonas haliotis]
MDETDTEQLESEAFQLGKWWVYPKLNQLVPIIESDAKAISIEPKMMDVLNYLCHHPNQVVSNEQLLIACWGGSFYGDAPVQKCIAMLRKKLGCQARDPSYIETIKRRGYRLIAQVSGVNRLAVVSPVNQHWQGKSPFLGLDAFSQQHQSVFYGRTQAIADVIHIAKQACSQSRHFVLILGSSGVGKSSLMRAGVLPLLLQTKGFAGLRFKHCIDLSRYNGGIGAPLQSLTEELQRVGLARNASGEALAPVDKNRGVLIFIDQFERLLNDTARQSEVKPLCRLCDALCRRDDVLLMVNLRNDCYANAMQYRDFARLKSLGVSYDLAAVTRGEIAQIIRKPAQMAGLSFERDAATGERLDDLLLEDAVVAPQALPLLQYTLSRLYEQRRDNRLLLSCYRSLGGLQGAITQQAEATYQSMPKQWLNHWQRLLHGVIGWSQHHQQLSAHPIALAHFNDSEAKLMIERFVDARLLVLSNEEGQAATVSLAHEALLIHWPRIAQFISDNRLAIEKHQQLQHDCQQWLEQDKGNDYLIVNQRKLDDAVWLSQRPYLSISPEQQQFIGRSRRRWRRAKLYKQVAIAAVITLSVCTAGFGMHAYQQKQLANFAQQKAESLVGYMLGDLRAQLEPIGKLDLLQGVAKQLVSYYQSAMNRQLETTADDQLAYAESLKLMAEIDIGKGQHAQGQTLLAQAQQLLEQVLQGAPNTVQARFLLSHVYYWQGLSPYYQGDLTATKVAWVNYLEQVKLLVEQQPEAQRWQYELALAHHNLGALARRAQDIGSARFYFGQSIAIKRQLVASEPDNQEYVESLANTLNWQVTLESRFGELALASQLAQEAYTIAFHLYSQYSDDFDKKYKYLTANNILVGVYLDQGLLEQAQQVLLQGTQLRDQLLAHDQTNNAWQAQAVLHDIRRLTLSHYPNQTHLIAHQTLSQTFAQRDLSSKRWLRSYLRFEAINQCDQAPRNAQQVSQLSAFLLDDSRPFLVDATPQLAFELARRSEIAQRLQWRDLLLANLPPLSSHNNLYTLLGHYYVAVLNDDSKQALKLFQSIKSRGYRHPQLLEQHHAFAAQDNGNLALITPN